MEIKIMEKIILVILLSIFSSSGWADCNAPKTSDEINLCIFNSVTELKIKLNSTYKKLYKQTHAKKELDNAQKAWLNYKKLQCIDFTIADTDYSPAQITFELACQTNLIDERIRFLEEQLH